MIIVDILYSVVKNPPANAGDAVSIPGLGRPYGGGNGSTLQYSCLGNLMDRGAWRTTVHRFAKSWTLLSMHSYTKELNGIIILKNLMDGTGGKRNSEEG